MKKLLERVALGATVCVLLLTDASAQVGIGTLTPNAQSLLHVSGTGRGVLMPYYSAADSAAAAGSYGVGEVGMVGYNTNLERLMVWTSTGWRVQGSGADLAFVRVGNRAINSPLVRAVGLGALPSKARFEIHPLSAANGLTALFGPAVSGIGFYNSVNANAMLFNAYFDTTASDFKSLGAGMMAFMAISDGEPYLTFGVSNGPVGAADALATWDPSVYIGFDRLGVGIKPIEAPFIAAAPPVEGNMALFGPNFNMGLYHKPGSGNGILFNGYYNPASSTIERSQNGYSFLLGNVDNVGLLSLYASTASNSLQTPADLNLIASFTYDGSLTLANALWFNGPLQPAGNSGVAGQVLQSTGAGAPVWATDGLALPFAGMSTVGLGNVLDIEASGSNAIAGLFTQSNATSATPALQGSTVSTNNGIGVLGTAYGASTVTAGVKGIAYSPSGHGVVGVSGSSVPSMPGGAIGVVGIGQLSNGYGGYFQGNATGGRGLRAEGTAIGVDANSPGGQAVYAQTNSGTALFATNTTGFGIVVTSLGGTGVAIANSGGGPALVTTSGRVGINSSNPNSTMTVSGSQSVKFDVFSGAGPHVLNETHYFLRIQAPFTGNVSVSLPTPSSCAGRVYYVLCDFPLGSSANLQFSTPSNDGFSGGGGAITTLYSVNSTSVRRFISDGSGTWWLF